MAAAPLGRRAQQAQAQWVQQVPVRQERRAQAQAQQERQAQAQAQQAQAQQAAPRRWSSR